MLRLRAVVGLAAAAALALGPAAPVAAAGLWSSLATLGQDGISTLGDAAVDPDGTAIVAWAAGGPVRAAVRPAGGPFDPTETLAQDGQTVAPALDGHGGALVAWSGNGSLGLAERTLERPALAAVPISIGDVRDGPDVAFVGTGRAVVVWSGGDGGIHALWHELGSSAVAWFDLAPGPGNTGPHVAAAGGHAVATWTLTERSGNQTRPTSGPRCSPLEARSGLPKTSRRPPEARPPS